jgi:predicted dehydrogenase
LREEDWQWSGGAERTEAGAVKRQVSMAMKSDLRVALVGTGFMGRLHSIAYAILPSFFPNLPSVRRQVVMDVTEELAQRGAKQFGYQESAVDWEKVIKRDDIDIVDITTPNDLHRPIAELALNHGKHVLCEKPLALSAESARRMSECAKRSSCVHMVGFNYRRCPAVLEAKRLVDGGALGKIFHFRASYLQDWAVSPETPFTWRFSAEQSGSGALGDIGSHALDLALYLGGEIVNVVGLTKTFVESRPKPGSGAMGPFRRVIGAVVFKADQKWTGSTALNAPVSSKFPCSQSKQMII